MATKLLLENRETRTEITINMRWLRSVLTPARLERLEKQAGTPEESVLLAEIGRELVTALKRFVADEPATLHDKLWLEKIATWLPKKDNQPQPIKLKDQARWLPLLVKLNRLEGDKDETIALSNQEVEAIWERMNSDEFTTLDFHHTWAEFVMDFVAQTGRHFAGITEDPDVEKMERELADANEPG